MSTDRLGAQSDERGGERVYLDHAATTPLRPEALEAMLPLLGGGFANPSGLHASSRRARRVVDDAREQLAAALGCEEGEVVFTSGGTEADNLAVAGVAYGSGATVLASAVEHHAVLDPTLYRNGVLAPVDGDGVLDLDRLAVLLERHAATLCLVAVMLANNETGVLQPLDEVVTLVRDHAPGALVHVDAVQAFPWCDVAGATASCDLVAVSAHKFGGPKGVGALVVRAKARERLSPLARGGGQERGLRPGTENVAGIAAMAAAATATIAERPATVARVAALRDRLAEGLVSSRPGVVEAAPRERRVAGNCLVALEATEGDEVCYLLDAAGIDASTGSACASGAREPSHVLLAMGWSRARAHSAVRLTLGATSSATDVERVLEVLPEVLDRLRS